MARYAFDRLSAQDASFLWAERENEPMHLGAVAVLEAGPLRTPEGGIDIVRYRRAVEAVLHWIPRYRQKIAWTPIEGWPVWVDDPHFDIGYHIRHVALPRPGTLAQLKELSGRILSRHLDRKRPLWEIWLIEGVEGGEQFALLNKIHHCMLDGAAGAELTKILFSPLASVEIEEPVDYLPRPAPTQRELLRDAVRRRAELPLSTVRSALKGRQRGGRSPAEEVRQRARALGDLVGYSLRPSGESPVNGDLSPHRRLDWLTMPLEDVKELRRVFDCTVNDIVLATVTGAMRRYLFRRRVDVRNLDFRTIAPVSVRRSETDHRQGNHVSSWIVQLPLDIEEPTLQLAAIRDRTAELKRSESSLGVETLMSIAEWLPPSWIAKGADLASGPANMIVTNVPGPQFPLYSVGARLLGLYPVVPLLPGGGVGIALFSYEGKLCWGFNVDYELVPDLPALVGDVATAFEQLRAAAVTHFIDVRTAPAEMPEPAIEIPVTQASGAAADEEAPPREAEAIH